MCRKQSVEELLADDFYGIRTPNNKNHMRLLVYYLAGIGLPSLKNRLSTKLYSNAL